MEYVMENPRVLAHFMDGKRGKQLALIMGHNPKGEQDI
jgi:hypothetical protein